MSCEFCNVILHFVSLVALLAHKMVPHNETTGSYFKTLFYNPSVVKLYSGGPAGD